MIQQENLGQVKKGWLSKHKRLLFSFVTIIVAWAFFGAVYLSGLLIGEYYWIYMYVNTFFVISLLVLAFAFVLKTVMDNPQNLRVVNIIGGGIPEYRAKIFVKAVNAQNLPFRTVKDILVRGSSLSGVKEQIRQWIKEDKIVVEVEKTNFFKGRIGNPDGMGLIMPKHFEISINEEQNGIMVHTEGWVHWIVYNQSTEVSFANDHLKLPRRQGWKTINKLWTKLEATSK
jgi:hypothetical protein